MYSTYYFASHLILCTRNSYFIVKSLIKNCRGKTGKKGVSRIATLHENTQNIDINMRRLKKFSTLWCSSITDKKGNGTFVCTKAMAERNRFLRRDEASFSNANAVNQYHTEIQQLAPYIVNESTLMKKTQAPFSAENNI